MEVDVALGAGIAEEIAKTELVAFIVTIGVAKFAIGVQDTEANVNINAKNNDFKIASLLILVNIVAAQRCALPAGGRDETTLLCRNQPPARNLPENAATPTRRVHAVLAALLALNGEIDHSKILFLRFSQTQLSRPLELTQYCLCRIPNEQQYPDSDNARENAQPLL